MVYVFIADGFEEIEAVVPIDILRRAGLDVVTVGVTGKTVTGSHSLQIVTDIVLNEAEVSAELEAIILPGGSAGADALEKSDGVNRFIDFAVENNILICAICAAPMILGHRGLLDSVKYTCYPGCEKGIDKGVYTAAKTQTDKKFITANGPGASFEFGYAIAARLSSERKVDFIKAGMKWHINEQEQ